MKHNIHKGYHVSIKPQKGHTAIHLPQEWTWNQVAKVLWLLPFAIYILSGVWHYILYTGPLILNTCVTEMTKKKKYVTVSIKKYFLIKTALLFSYD